MFRRHLPIVVIASCALLLGAASAAPAFGPGETFLTGGLDLPAGAVAGGASGWDGSAADRSSVSGDGRFVAFVSQADTLDASAHPDVVSVYRKDRFLGGVVLVSRASDGTPAPASSTQPVISDDGTRVAFRTAAALDSGDADGADDVYVRDLLDGTTRLATVGTATDVGGFDLSGDGGFVVFATEDRVGSTDANDHSDVYRRDLEGERTQLVSVNRFGLNAGDGASIDPSISDDGVWVAFASQAADLFSGYHEGTGYQVFVRDMRAGETHLVSNENGSFDEGSNGESTQPDIAARPSSGDRSAVLIAYTSAAANIDDDDRSTQDSVFLRQLSSTASVLVSRQHTAGGGASADGPSGSPAISDDGDLVAFESQAANLGGGPGVYLRRVSDGATLRIAPAGVPAEQPAVADDGGYLAWAQVRGVTADSDPDLSAVFGRSHAAPSTLEPVELVSRPPVSDPSGDPEPFLSTWIEVDPEAAGPRTVSADGRYVVFKATTSRLLGGAPGGLGQIYRRDTLTGAIELVSRVNGAAGDPGEGNHGQPTISGDGSRVAFRSTASLDPAHTDGSVQAYVRDLARATTTLVSRTDGAVGAVADDGAIDPVIAPGGGHVVFATSASNLGAPGGDQHVYMRDLAAGRTSLVDRAAGTDGEPGNDDAALPSPSADGRLVAFASQADNLDPDDLGSDSDVYVRDMVAGATTLVSRRSGLTGLKANGPSSHPALSADGAVVAFQASDDGIAPEAGGWGANEQIVARTLATGANVLVSRAPAGAPADAAAEEPSIDGDGSVVAFQSVATNLLPGVGGGSRHGVFARTMATGALTGPPPFGILAESPGGAARPSISGDGQCLAFVARGHNAITGTAGDGSTTYMHVVSGECPKPAPAPPPVGRRASAPRLRARMARKRFRVGRARTARVAGPVALRGAARAAARRGKRRTAKRRKACLRRAGRRPVRRRACLRGGRRARVGSAFVVTLSERANVGIRIERQAEGRLVGRFCRKPQPRLRRNLRCIRFAKVGNLSRRGVRAGTTRVAFTGRIGKRALKPGKYRVRVRASNAGGTSRWVRLRFRVVRR